MKYLLFKLLPKNLFSRLMGTLAETRLPSPLMGSLISLYSHIYKIQLDEVDADVKQMTSFNEFFTRPLKPEARPIDASQDSVASPVDAKVAQAGKIENGLLVQAKGIYYTLEDLVGGEMAELFNGGNYLTLYLSPADYHRIHSPVQGTVDSFTYFSGNLWPVNEFGVQNIGSLLAVNERIVTPIKTQSAGTIGMVKVGALVVGKIKVRYSPFTSNRSIKGPLNLPVHPPKAFEKGEELGRFQLGSTVILLFEKGRFTLDKSVSIGAKLKMGQRIGSLREG